MTPDPPDPQGRTVPQDSGASQERGGCPGLRAALDSKATRDPRDHQDQLALRVPVVLLVLLVLLDPQDGPDPMDPPEPQGRKESLVRRALWVPLAAMDPKAP